MKRCEPCANHGRIHNVPDDDPEPEPVGWPDGWCVPCADAGRYHFVADCPEGK